MKGCITQTALSIYPVGSIYLSVNSTSPATLFGGTWIQLENRFLIGAGSSYTNGATGGEATHTLTVSEMPSHNHRGRMAYDQAGYGYTPTNWEVIIKSYSTPLTSSGGTAATDWADINANNLAPTSSSGGSAAHNNMPPYLVVFMWKRTA